MAVDIRAKLKQLMTDTLADEAAHHTWTYEEVRPLAVPPTWKPGQHVVADCSKGVQYLMRWAGGPDPMGSAFGPYGNSQTIWTHAQHLGSPGGLNVGDVVTFGYDGDAHAAMVYEKGSDPLLWSFGHQGAPNTYRLSYDRRPKQYCVMPIPNYVPTPEDKLRAATGWFSWVAWRLGEGDWKHYGIRNSHVRPAVPMVIPPAWWKRYAVFIANRQKGTPPSTV